jgi:hypothetical protein
MHILHADALCSTLQHLEESIGTERCTTLRHENKALSCLLFDA